MKHIALKYSFNELLSGLQGEIDKGYIARKDCGDLSLFNYMQSCQFEKAWNDFSLVARGLILHIQSKKIIALPFPKFFNYGEHSFEIPKEEFSISEKMDGSLGIIYFWNNWHVATRGAFSSEQAQWAEQWLHEHINTSELDRNVTYLAEIVYPENRIVVKYSFSGLVLLSGYHLDNGQELDEMSLNDFAKKTGFFRPEIYRYSFAELLNIAKSLSSDKEGFVIRFESGLRLKIKGDEYCRIHRLLSHVTPLGVWNSFMANDNLDAIRRELPEEYLKDFDKIIEILSENLNGIIEAVHEACERTKEWTDKELGLAIQSNPNQFNDAARRFIFTARKKGFFEQVNETCIIREKVFKLFRPAGNVLSGYVPANTVNRFINENDL